ncbi:hypothetical protein Afe04nite_48920 [Asanoa ferruginea]|nr:hypothetical protein Afe04nite_48920 [Asanoa ferruginea]
MSGALLSAKSVRRAGTAHCRVAVCCRSGSDVAASVSCPGYACLPDARVTHIMHGELPHRDPATCHIADWNLETPRVGRSTLGAVWGSSARDLAKPDRRDRAPAALFFHGSDQGPPNLAEALAASIGPGKPRSPVDANLQYRR